METVLQKISEYDIFRYYMSDKSWKINNVTISPFIRADGKLESNPSFIIGNKHGNLSFIDFGDTNHRGDCFEFVKVLFGFNSLDEILRKIDSDFGLGFGSTPLGDYKKITKEYSQPEDMGKRYSIIQVKTRNFTHEELAYWNMYYQDIQDLRDNHIYSIDTLYFNRSKFPLKETELRFGYLYDGHWKIYHPYGDKKHKWMPNNVPITTMDGLEDIIDCDTVMIQKSKKDYMVMKKVYPYNCAVQNEGIACFSPNNVGYLKMNTKRQILSFDSDVTGVANSQQITKLFDFDYCNVPRMYLQEGIKDWAELGRRYGLKLITDILKLKGINSCPERL